MRKILMAVGAAVAAVLPLNADTRTNEVDGVTWQYTVTDGVATLGTGKYSWNGRAVIGTPPADIVIPAEIDGLPVVNIAPYGFFWYYTELENVTIPEGVTNIAYGAFDSCRALKRVTIPASVKSIDSRYGWSAFGSCRALEEVVFAGNMDEIDMDIIAVFRGCPWLESLDFSLVVKNNCVSGFTGVCPETITVPDGVIDILYGAFSSDSFPSATNLVHLVLPESVSYIGGNVCGGCDNFVSVNIPAGVSEIDSGAFRDCPSLSDVTFGREDYLTYYDMMAFKGTPFYDMLPFRLEMNWRSTDGGETWQASVTNYIGKCPDNLDIQAVHVAQWEADRQRNLEEYGYDIGDAPAIVGIEQQVFADCGLKSVTLPASLSVIGYGAFFNCTNLTKVVFTGNAPAEIAEDAFWVYSDGYDEWGNLEPHYGANTNCTIHVPANSTGWGVEIPGEWMGMKIIYSTAFIVENGVLVAVVAGEDNELTIPSGVTNIAANAFDDSPNLERVNIPDGVTSISPTAFDGGCEKLWAKWFKTLERLSSEEVATAGAVSLTVTNVVVHYVTQSVPSDAVIPPTAAGIVNIISEVNAGAAIAITEEWAAQYPDFAAKFGSDFTKAVTALTGKRDGAGKPMMVWQDFVAGTDPTDKNDVFTASITFDSDGKPVISYSPEFADAAEAAKRTYTTYGKVKLNDAKWIEVPDGEEANYNFFKVTVEMK